MELILEDNVGFTSNEDLIKDMKRFFIYNIYISDDVCSTQKKLKSIVLKYSNREKKLEIEYSIINLNQRPRPCLYHTNSSIILSDREKALEFNILLLKNFLEKIIWS